MPPIMRMGAGSRSAALGLHHVKAVHLQLTARKRDHERGPAVRMSRKTRRNEREGDRDWIPLMKPLRK
jgi:hypothetical protein